MYVEVYILTLVHLLLLSIKLLINARIFIIYTYIHGDRGSTVVKVLCYKTEGRWFDPSWCQWISDRTMALGSTQPLTEMSTRSIS